MNPVLSAKVFVFKFDLRSRRSACGWWMAKAFLTRIRELFLNRENRTEIYPGGMWMISVWTVTFRTRRAVLQESVDRDCFKEESVVNSLKKKCSGLFLLNVFWLFKTVFLVVSNRNCRPQTFKKENVVHAYSIGICPLLRIQSVCRGGRKSEM